MKFTTLQTNSANDLIMQWRALPKKDNGKQHRNRKFRMSDSEVITILTLFHLKQFRNMKAFYTQCIQVHHRQDFNTVSYNRFVELQQRVTVKITLFLQLCCLGKCTGISFIDSAPIRVCHIKRERSHKMFKGSEEQHGMVLWF